MLSLAHAGEIALAELHLLVERLITLEKCLTFFGKEAFRRGLGEPSIDRIVLAGAIPRPVPAEVADVNGPITFRGRRHGRQGSLVIHVKRTCILVLALREAANKYQYKRNNSLEVVHIGLVLHTNVSISREYTQNSPRFR